MSPCPSRLRDDSGRGPSLPRSRWICSRRMPAGVIPPISSRRSAIRWYRSEAVPRFRLAVNFCRYVVELRPPLSALTPPVGDAGLTQFVEPDRALPAGDLLEPNPVSPDPVPGRRGRAWGGGDPVVRGAGQANIRLGHKRAVHKLDRAGRPRTRATVLLYRSLGVSRAGARHTLALRLCPSEGTPIRWTQSRLWFEKLDESDKEAVVVQVWRAQMRVEVRRSSFQSRPERRRKRGTRYCPRPHGDSRTGC